MPIPLPLNQPIILNLLGHIFRPRHTRLRVELTLHQQDRRLLRVLDLHVSLRVGRLDRVTQTHSSDLPRTAGRAGERSGFDDAVVLGFEVLEVGGARCPVEAGDGGTGEAWVVLGLGEADLLGEWGGVAGDERGDDGGEALEARGAHWEGVAVGEADLQVEEDVFGAEVGHAGGAIAAGGGYGSGGGGGDELGPLELEGGEAAFEGAGALVGGAPAEEGFELVVEGFAFNEDGVIGAVVEDGVEDEGAVVVGVELRKGLARLRAVAAAEIVELLLVQGRAETVEILGDAQGVDVVEEVTGEGFAALPKGFVVVDHGIELGFVAWKESGAFVPEGRVALDALGHANAAIVHADEVEVAGDGFGEDRCTQSLKGEELGRGLARASSAANKSLA